MEKHQTKELRQGNLVMVDGEIVVVDDFISDCGINIIHDSWQFDMSKVEAINLSSDLLLKLGFKQSEDELIFHIHKKIEDRVIQISTNLNGNVFLYCGSDAAGADIRLLLIYRYIHQVQNLWYSLTHEDLVYNK